eukprot:TRINITY_DN5929_c0_g1_i2.p1 TRINITY_DN5929_c0_g1~~TRINITY_DN5929_c0_g1_i2.p1  ORF type:complete len:427 (-),score=124.88 TRINITY_DN5929_c0_g1_i2:444-1724(-)
MGIQWHLHAFPDKAKDGFTKAKEITGLVTEMTGVLGKRTKFQTFDTSQLILKAESKNKDENEKDSVPKEVEHDDDLLLPKPELIEKVETSNLRVIDQAIILSLCLNVKNQNPKSGLTTEEMMPFVARVLENPNDWLVHTTSLLLKSRLDSEHHRTAERGVLQLQAIVDQFEDQETPAYKRLPNIFILSYPSITDLRVELGERYLSLGAAATSLEIFRSVHNWDRMIDCYRLMSKMTLAEQLLRERIAIEPTPLLYCILGDVVNDDQYYIKAWEMSGKRFARAQRGLAISALKRNDWAKCVEHYEIALNINPLFPNSWFSFGCALMRTNQLERAARAFGRVVQQEPDLYEAWANMATIYISLKKNKEAFLALQESLKLNRQNWKIWSNFVYVCMDIGEFSQAITGIKEILELDVKGVDVEVVFAHFS